ncbi:unnamed protein product, partial [Discosporangium mesarthrocarpum]
MYQGGCVAKGLEGGVSGVPAGQVCPGHGQSTMGPSLDFGFGPGLGQTLPHGIQDSRSVLPPQGQHLNVDNPHSGEFVLGSDGPNLTPGFSQPTPGLAPVQFPGAVSALPPFALRQVQLPLPWDWEQHGGGPGNRTGNPHQNSGSPHPSPIPNKPTEEHLEWSGHNGHMGPFAKQGNPIISRGIVPQQKQMGWATDGGHMSNFVRGHVDPNTPPLGAQGDQRQQLAEHRDHISPFATHDQHGLGMDGARGDERVAREGHGVHALNPFSEHPGGAGWGTESQSQGGRKKKRMRGKRSGVKVHAKSAAAESLVALAAVPEPALGTAPGVAPAPAALAAPVATASSVEDSEGEREQARLEETMKQRALRALRSAPRNHVLVLVGAAVVGLPPERLAEAAGMEGARWVSRHELSEPKSLPLEVKPEIARLLGECLPVCTTVEDIEAGHEFLLLMTFISGEAKLDAVRRLEELGFDVSGFDCSAKIQVERAMVGPAPQRSAAILPEQGQDVSLSKEVNHEADPEACTLVTHGGATTGGLRGGWVPLPTPQSGPGNQVGGAG